MKLLLTILLTFFFLQFSTLAKGQGCSDAGFCTVGTHVSQRENSETKELPHNEFDIQYTAARHGHNERFYVPQLNYRHFNKKGSFFEIRLPLNIAKDRPSETTNSGIGDITTTYNGRFPIHKKYFLDYSLGLRVSFSHSDKTDGGAFGSYPMFLQNGLGTTDFIAVANYNIFKYLSIGAGAQLPIFQYNKNILPLYSVSGIYQPRFAYNFRRQPDALLRLDGHLPIKKLNIDGGILAIFHLDNDYYKSYRDELLGTEYGKYTLSGSKGTTINFDINFTYPFGKHFLAGLLYAAPIKTRSNIPDGLARSQVITPKVTWRL